MWTRIDAHNRHRRWLWGALVVLLAVGMGIALARCPPASAQHAVPITVW